MNIIEIIEEKKQGRSLSPEEIQWVISSYTKEQIPEYQMSALLMAIYFQGMDEAETRALTQAMIDSGDRVDIDVEAHRLDKHSTGGVGDKTSLIVGPIVAACGLSLAKMSGRGLGHTGGTLDKLESIPGFSVDLPGEKFAQGAREVGFVIAGQTANITPADKKLYALRDITATVDSIPLIASSIMSKKLAVANEAFLLDVKVGNGAFMKDEAHAVELAEELVSIGESFGRKTAALITSMDQPLGRAVGNSLEVMEAIKTLRGEGPADLVEITNALATKLLILAATPEEEAKSAVAHAIQSGAALEKFREFVRFQGGDPRVLEDFSLFPQVSVKREIFAEEDGFIADLPALEIGLMAGDLGAGRKSLTDAIDLGAGIYLHKKMGDAVSKGDKLATLYTNREDELSEVVSKFYEVVKIGTDAPTLPPLIRKEVSHV